MTSSHSFSGWLPPFDADLFRVNNGCATVRTQTVAITTIYSHLVLSTHSPKRRSFSPPPAMTSQPRRDRAFSDRAQAVPAGAPSRPGMGDRTSSAPAGDLYKLDNERRPSARTNVNHTLVEEDESIFGMSASTGALGRSGPRQCDEVRPGDPWKVLCRRDLGKVHEWTI